MKLHPIRINRFKFWWSIWKRGNAKYKGFKKVIFGLGCVKRMVIIGDCVIYPYIMGDD